MGCRNSKSATVAAATTLSSSSSLVELCHERRKLIASSIDNGYAMAAAYSAYFDALRAVGAAFQCFVEEELDGTTMLPAALSRSTSSSFSSSDSEGSNETKPINENQPQLVLRMIKEQFEFSAGLGHEVLKMLQGDKLNQIKKKFVSTRSASLLSTSKASLRQSLNSTITVRKGEANITESQVQDCNPKDNISTTLEKLSIWEEKLYTEAKDMEKLKKEYEKKYEKLKSFDQKEAEPSKIQSTQASVRELSTKLSIAINSVDSISRKLHKIRYDELQPQFTKLIEGFATIWKALQDCHKNQLQAVLDSKRYHLMSIRTRNESNAVGKTTCELEKEIANWQNCFDNLIAIEQSYFRSLTEWLSISWPPEEQEDETLDSHFVQSSRSRAQAPAVFIISNDFKIALERVIHSMKKFARNVHGLWEIQNAEVQQRLEKEQLSRAYNTRLRLMLDIDMDGHRQQCDEDLSFAFKLVKTRVDEKIQQHKETVRELQCAASKTLPKGLVPLFEALENFSAQKVKAYGQVGI